MDKDRGSGPGTMSLAGKRYELHVECARRQDGCTSRECELEPGDYAALPVVLSGRRAARPGSRQDTVSLTVYSEPKLKNVSMLDSLPAAATMRDLLILQAQEHGEINLYTGDGGALLYMKETCGLIVVALNRSKRYPLRVTVNADKSLRTESSRGSLSTSDVVPEGHAQVIMVLTFSCQHGGPKSYTWSSRIQPEAPGSHELHSPSIGQQSLHVPTKLS